MCTIVSTLQHRVNALITAITDTVAVQDIQLTIQIQACLNICIRAVQLVS